MFQRSVRTFIPSVAVITIAAITVSTAAMGLSVSIAEVNRHMDNAAIDGLIDLVAVIFLTLLNVVAVGTESLVTGVKIGLYSSAAISVAYLVLLLLRQDNLAPPLWRLVLSLALAEAGAIGAKLGASGIDVRYLHWFSAGAALFGLLASFLLANSHQDRLVHTPIQQSPTRQAPFVTLITLIVGAGAILLFMLSPLNQPNRTAAEMMREMTLATVIEPGNAASVVELAHVEAKDVTQALFFPGGGQIALATSDGVVLYDTATLTPIRTIETGASRRIALSPDGKSLATMAGANAQVWQVSDGSLLTTLAGHTGTVQDVAFSPDGRIVATASPDRSVRMWRVSNGELLYTLSHLGHVYSLGFRADGQVLATGSDMGITLWQPNSGLRLRITDVIFATAHAVAFSPTGLHLAAAMSTGTVRLRLGNNYTVSSDLPDQEAVTALAFSPNGELLAFGGNGQVLQLWNISQQRSLATLIGHQGAINSITFSPDGRLLVTTALDGTVRLWGTGRTPTMELSSPVASSAPLTAGVASVATVANVATPTPIPTATPTTKSAPRVRVTIAVPASQPVSPIAEPNEVPTSTSTATIPPTPTPTATRTATRAAMPTPTRTPIPMPVEPGAIVPSIVGDLAVQREVNFGSAADMAYSADGRLIAVTAGRRVLILDGQTLAEIDVIETAATTLAFSPDGETLVTASGTVANLWRLVDGELLNKFELHGSAIMDIVFSPDGATLATASLDQIVRLWRASDAALLRQFSHFGSVHSLAFSPDGEILATGTTVGVVQWRVNDGVRLRVLTLNPNRANSLVYSPDGQNLAAATENGNIWFWRAGGAREWLVLHGHTNAAADVAFSPDGQLLASASADGKLRLWRTGDGATLRTLSDDTALTSVTFHPDGTTLLTAAADGTLQLWGLPALVVTPTMQNPTSSTEAIAVPPLRVVTIEPTEVTVVASDWQIVGSGSRFAEVTLCVNDLLWYTPDLLYEGRGLWSFDGQRWELHFSGDIVVVACDPDGAPYALVVPKVSRSAQGPTDSPPVTVYRREDGQWTEVVSWAYGYKVWQSALFFDLAVDRDGGIWLPSLLGVGNEGGVISALLHFDGSNWHIYVGADENRLDDSLALAGRTFEDLKILQILKTLPSGYDQPTTFAEGAELLLPQWMSDVDLAADGTVWISRPFLWPERFDGQRWQRMVEPQLLAHIMATLDELGVAPRDDAPTLAEYGALDGNGAAWLGVTGGVLHSEQGRWMLYHLPASEQGYGPLIPLVVGSDGSIWFWQSDTLLRYDGVNWQRFIGDDNFRQMIGSPYSYQPGLFLDATVGPDGALWIGGLRLLPGGTPLSLPKELAQ